MASKKIGIELPEKLANDFDRFVQEKGLVKQRAIEAALRGFMSLPASDRDLLLKGDEDRLIVWADAIASATSLVSIIPKSIVGSLRHFIGSKASSSNLVLSEGEVAAAGIVAFMQATLDEQIRLVKAVRVFDLTQWEHEQAEVRSAPVAAPGYRKAPTIPPPGADKKLPSAPKSPPKS